MVCGSRPENDYNTFRRSVLLCHIASRQINHRRPLIAAVTTPLFDVSPDKIKLPAACSLLPVNPSFAGHQTFPVRSGWLKKGVDALLEDGTVFNRPDALVTLGVGKNMVTSFRHWLLMTGVAHVDGRELRVTPLGKRISGDQGGGYDAYLEDPATLWILHWNLCGPGSTAFPWAWAFNILREYESCET